MSRSRAHQHVLRLAALLCLGLVGCVPPSGPVGTPPRRTSAREISREEIAAGLGRFSTAYEIVRALRPNMLQSRGTPRPERPGIRVYRDGIPFGGVETLAMIPAREVLDVRWLSGIDATTRYGTGNSAGAIVVTTHTGRR